MERRKIQEDKPWWVDKETNAVALMCLTQRAAVLLGKDHVKILDRYKQPSTN